MSDVSIAKDLGDPAVRMAHEINDPIIVAFLLVIAFLILVVWMQIRANAKKDNVYGEILARKDDQLYGLAKEMLTMSGALSDFTRVFEKLVPEDLRKRLSSARRQKAAEQSGDE